MVMCVSLFLHAPRWWCAHVLTEETQRHAEGGTMVMTPGEEPPEDGGRDWSRRSVRVRTARIQGMKPRGMWSSFSWSFLSQLGSTNSLDFRLLVSRTGRIRFCCFKPSVCGTSLTKPWETTTISLKHVVIPDNYEAIKDDWVYFKRTNEPA